MRQLALQRTGILTTMVFAAGALAGPAVALTSVVGGPEIRIDIRAETVATASNVVAFNDVPGTEIVVVVPAGSSRFFTARFTAESQCFSSVSNAQQSFCRLQIVATNTAPGGATTPFVPDAGGDYFFDSNPAGAADDLYESLAMERSIRLGPGQYSIRVQRSVLNTGTTHRLDDWHFALETNKI